MSEGPLSYEDKLEIAEQAFQLMHHPEFQEQLHSFLAAIPRVWPEYLTDGPGHHLFNEEMNRLVQNMLMIGICGGRGYSPSDLNLTETEVERYAEEQLRYQKEINRRILENAVPLTLEGLYDAEIL